MFEENQADIDMAFERCTEDDGQVNFGIGDGGIKPKEFPNANPGGLVTSEVNLASSGIILQDSDRDHASQYQSLTQREELKAENRSGEIYRGDASLRNAGNRVAQSHEKKFMAAKNINQARYQAGFAGDG